MPNNGTDRRDEEPAITISPDTATDRIVAAASMALVDAGRTTDAARYADEVRRASANAGPGRRDAVLAVVSRWVTVHSPGPDDAGTHGTGARS